MQNDDTVTKITTCNKLFFPRISIYIFIRILPHFVNAAGHNSQLYFINLFITRHMPILSAVLSTYFRKVSLFWAFQWNGETSLFRTVWETFFAHTITTLRVD